MDIEFVTGLWTHISDHLEKNHTKIVVSRNDHFLDTALRFPTLAKVAIYPFVPYQYSTVRKKPLARNGKN